MKNRVFSDTELLERMTNNDNDAFRQIYYRYWKQLYFHALKKTRCKEVAEELVQNVFIGLWNRRHTSKIQCPAVYLQQAIRYQVINYLESKIANEKNIAATFALEPEAAVSCDSITLVNELSAAINKAIQKLPEKSQEVMQFSRINHYSVREISARMHISEKAVEYHITRSLKLMRYYLKDFFLWIVTLNNLF